MRMFEEPIIEVQVFEVENLVTVSYVPGENETPFTPCL